MDQPAATTKVRKPGSPLPLILTIVGLCIGATIGGIATQYGIDYVRNTAVHQQLIAASTDLNAKAPKMVDNLTRFDGTSVIGEALRYHYTLVSTRLTQLDLPRFTSLMRANVLSNYRTNPEMQTFREEGVSLQYNYFDEDGKPIVLISVGPKDLP